MSRALYLAMSEGDALARCKTDGVGVSCIEALPTGGVRLVCMSVDDAIRLRHRLKSKLIKGDIVRARHRPRAPIW